MNNFIEKFSQMCVIKSLHHRRLNQPGGNCSPSNHNLLIFLENLYSYFIRFIYDTKQLCKTRIT
jgi:hypothetical protein